MAPSALEVAMVETAMTDPAVRNDLTNMAMANTGLLFILFYDHLLTLPDEVKVIWPMPWKLPKFLFIINRYIVPAFLIFHTFTYVLFNINSTICTVKIWSGAPCIFSLTCVQGLLMLRVEALYRGAKKIKIFLYITFALQIAATVALSGVIIPNVHGYSGGDMLPGCLYIMPEHMELIWLPGTMFEILLAVMTIYQACILGFRSVLIRVLVGDAFVYFAAIFTCLLVSLIYPKLGQRFLAPPLLLPSAVIASLGTARITINLRLTPEREAGVTPNMQERNALHFRVNQSNHPILSAAYHTPPGTDHILIKMDTFVETDTGKAV